MSDAVLDTLSRDPRVQAAMMSVTAAWDQVEVARGGYLPQVTADVGVVGTEAHSQYQLNVRQMLYDWGRVSSEVQSSEAAGQLSRAELRIAESDTSLDAAVTYLSYLRGQSGDDIYREYAEVLARFERIAEARHQGRFSGVVEVDRARVERARAIEEQARYQGLAWSARRDFLVLAGEDPEQLDLETPHTLPVLRDYGDPQALESAILAAPLVGADLAELERAEAELELAEARRWPQINLEADWFRRDFNGLVDTDTSVALRLRSDSLFGARQLRQPRAARNRVSASRFQLDASKRDLRRGMQQLMAQEPSLLARIVALDDQIARSASIVETYEEQFLAGLRDFEELLSVTREHFSARRQRMELKLDLLQLQYQTAADLGVLTRLLLQESGRGSRA
ncbi:TolC family protein [Parahaliea aestuarii]|uniref:TolC family protein n=1 Tax=Parahaliea aestuarii TaxID=1852021 RepID=A0A5C8ZL52_9GAMM|nr:TolC family protein [Parahaliea aestuarii]TXS89178.1 hypothetical protein FVW59_18825 [Parahaliea aestuarii]